MEGKCAFEEKCWYSHKNIKSTIIKEFKCRFCDKCYKRKEEFMVHRKMEHENFVPACRADKNDSCRFSDKECWYKHEDDEYLNKYAKYQLNQLDEEVPSNMNTRLLDMMEKFTERLQNLEDQI